jgi:hypothetical protein
VLGRFFRNPVHESCGWLVSCLIGAYQNDLQVPSIASIADPVPDWCISESVILGADGIYGLCARGKLVVKGDDVVKPHDVTQRSPRWEVI